MPDFNQIWNLSTDFRKSTQYCSVGVLVMYVVVFTVFLYFVYAYLFLFVLCTNVRITATG
jgi:hypothetical protein